MTLFHPSTTLTCSPASNCGAVGGRRKSACAGQAQALPLVQSRGWQGDHLLDDFFVQLLVSLVSSQFHRVFLSILHWIPAFAGMTGEKAGCVLTSMRILYQVVKLRRSAQKSALHSENYVFVSKFYYLVIRV